MCLKKSIIVNEELFLIVKVIGTIGVTDGRPYQYMVKAWTNVNDKYQTMVVASEGDPEFNENLLILQDKNNPAEFLYVDVFKKNSVGTYFVGRGVTFAPMSKVSTELYCEVDLFGHEETAGFLQLSLCLEELDILGYASS